MRIAEYQRRKARQAARVRLGNGKKVSVSEAGLWLREWRRWVDEGEADLVPLMRELGYTWPDIGSVLGMNPDSLRRKWSKVL